MSAPRFAAPIPPTCLPRSSLVATSYPGIDAALKQLKTCTRRLNAALLAHRNELQILERLYYKGKNQHRTALFWQRVAETRKYGKRLEDMDMYNLVENERLSFWGDTSTRTPKVLKRSWTHFPDSRSVLFVLRRCSECCALVTKTRERLIEAYHSFTLIMQTGAFLQLVLTLAAVASRLGSLLIEVSATIVHCQHAFYEVLQAIDPTQAASVKHILQKDAVDDNAQSGGDILPQPATVPEPGEDLGNTVKRSSALVQETTANLLQVEQSPSLSTKAADRDSDLAAMSVVTSVRTAVKRKSSSSGPTLLPNDQSIQRRNGEHQQQNEVNKRKKKRDEIDDIFGF